MWGISETIRLIPPYPASTGRSSPVSHSLPNHFRSRPGASCNPDIRGSARSEACRRDMPMLCDKLAAELDRDHDSPSGAGIIARPGLFFCGLNRKFQRKGSAMDWGGMDDRMSSNSTRRTIHVKKRPPGLADTPAARVRPQHAHVRLTTEEPNKWKSGYASKTENLFVSASVMW